ncbi:MAG: response regulator [Deltaproteobacteria bacterium]|nr:response regulator [Deltaproteobacteria bacterium]
MHPAAISTPEAPTALIVNDDPSQLRLIRAVLEKAGLQTRGCNGAEEALDALSIDPAVDLIVTDLHMPGIDGWRFCQLLRSPDFAPLNRIPILVVSATFSGRDAEQLSLDLGASAFLAAPFAPSALQEYARALLSGRRPEPAPHVLIAHADRDEAERLRAAFLDAGYTVDCTSNGAETLATWRALHPEVAVIDEGLPDRSAAEVLATIKTPGSRTVAFAIAQQPAREVSLTRRGADGILRGPADAQQLIELAEKVRRQRSLMRIEELFEQRGRALRDSESRWRSLFESIPESVIVHDADGVILHVNPTAAEQLQWPAHELIGRNLHEFEPTDEADAARPALRGGQVETVWVARSGHRIPVEIIQRQMHFEGRPAILSVARDISARLALAQQRQNFLAMLTHDIKNPLAIVLGFTELLGEVGPLNPEQADLVARMQANASTVLSLVANYLNLTQIESGQLALTRKPVMLEQVIDAVLAQYRGQAARDAVTLESTVAGPLGVVNGDVLALERVLTNLVHNALKFTPEGGRVVVTARRDGNGAALEVRDTGIGIAAADLATLFQPYRRGATRQPREGVGLGLFIAHSLVEAHQGRLTVDSTPGQGTTFTVWLPAS